MSTLDDETIAFLVKALAVATERTEPVLLSFADPEVAQSICVNLAVLSFICHSNGKPEDEVMIKRVVDLVAHFHVWVKRRLGDGVIITAE